MLLCVEEVRTISVVSACVKGLCRKFCRFLPESQIKRGKAFFYQDLSGLISNIARDRNKPPTRPITLGDTHHVAMAIKTRQRVLTGF